MKRKDLYQLIKIAGYHADNKTAYRLYVENSISRKKFDEWFGLGASMKASGAKCECSKCRA